MNNEDLIMQNSNIIDDINNIKKQIEDLRIKKNKLIKKLRWQKYYDKNYQREDFTQTKAYKIFGKRKKDLTKDELKEFNKIVTRQSREKRLKTNE